MSSEAPRRKGKGYKWLPGTWFTLAADIERSLPAGTRLAVNLAGIETPMVKRSDSGWSIETRNRVPANKLVGRTVAPRVARGGGSDPNATADG